MATYFVLNKEPDELTKTDILGCLKKISLACYDRHNVRFNSTTYAHLVEGFIRWLDGVPLSAEVDGQTIYDNDAIRALKLLALIDDGVTC